MNRQYMPRLWIRFTRLMVQLNPLILLPEYVQNVIKTNCQFTVTSANINVVLDESVGTLANCHPYQNQSQSTSFSKYFWESMPHDHPRKACFACKLTKVSPPSKKSCMKP